MTTSPLSVDLACSTGLLVRGINRCEKSISAVFDDSKCRLLGLDRRILIQFLAHIALLAECDLILDGKLVILLFSGRMNYYMWVSVNLFFLLDILFLNCLGFFCNLLKVCRLLFLLLLVLSSIIYQFQWLFDVCWSFWMICTNYSLSRHNFKGGSTKDRIRGQICHFPFSRVSFSKALKRVEQFLFGWIIPLISQFKVEMFSGWVQFFLLPLQTDILVVHNIAPLLVHSSPEVLVGDWSVSFDVEGGGVEGGSASDCGRGRPIGVEDVGVGVGGVESLFYLLDVVVVVQLGRGVLAVIANHNVIFIISQILFWALLFVFLHQTAA